MKSRQELLITGATKVTEEYGKVCGQGSELRLPGHPSTSEGQGVTMA